MGGANPPGKSFRVVRRAAISLIRANKRYPAGVRVRRGKMSWDPHRRQKPCPGVSRVSRVSRAMLFIKPKRFSKQCPGMSRGVPGVPGNCGYKTYAFSFHPKQNHCKTNAVSVDPKQKHCKANAFFLDHTQTPCETNAFSVDPKQNKCKTNVFVWTLSKTM